MLTSCLKTCGLITATPSTHMRGKYYSKIWVFGLKTKHRIAINFKFSHLTFRLDLALEYILLIYSNYFHFVNHFILQKSIILIDASHHNKRKHLNPLFVFWKDSPILLLAFVLSIFSPSLSFSSTETHQNGYQLYAR